MRSRTTSVMPGPSVAPLAISTSRTLAPPSASDSASARVQAAQEVRSSPTGASPRWRVVPGTWTARTAMARSRTSEAVAISGRSATSSPPLERTWRGPRMRTSSASSASARAIPTASAVMATRTPTRARGGTTAGAIAAAASARPVSAEATTTARRPRRPRTSRSSTDHSGGSARVLPGGGSGGALSGALRAVVGLLIVGGAYRRRPVGPRTHGGPRSRGGLRMQSGVTQ